MNGDNLLEIDGSFGEGGGAILRLSAAYSVLFKRPIRIRSIRANRPKPGLRLQHLLGLKTLSEVSKSALNPCGVGSEEIFLTPNSTNDVKSTIHLNISTAASIGLLLQPIQIASLGFKKPVKIEIFIKGGGTFGKWAPSINYLQEVTYNLFERSGLKIDIDILKHGFYPKGGAQLKCVIHPSKENIKPINLTELGNVDLIQGDIIITNHLRRNRDNIGSRIRKSIQQQLRRNLKCETDIKYSWVDSISPGVGVSLWAQSDTGAIISTGTFLGEKKLSSEKLGYIVAQEMLNYLQNEIPVDKYLSDQLIPLMGYVKKPSSIKVFEITSHTRTNLELIKLFTNREYKTEKHKNYHLINFQ
ncbi:MAG: RNA 3'-phosphate cyclase [Candidatus Lokiarchaeota archaeon]|nr:RNA 3'-phosphate cyclase [Candidatus Lokiarchaeota archaeon]